MRVLITGGSGFIGTHLCRMLLEDERVTHVANVDVLTYASNREMDSTFKTNPKYSFHHIDICDTPQILDILRKLKIDSILNLAAESHVDNSIHNSKPFVQTNVMGTVSLLDAFVTYVGPNLTKHKFVQISTDEVFGSLKLQSKEFNELSPLAPKNPYSASKAAAEHFVRAYANTHGIQTNITNCSNNFGKFQHREKLIPTVVRKFMDQESVPIYGNGQNIRDWVFVEDHCRALIKVLFLGHPGESYCIGGGMELSNIQLVLHIFKVLQSLGFPVKQDIQYVIDRKGHDLRYAIADFKITKFLGAYKEGSFSVHLADTVKWYAQQDK